MLIFDFISALAKLDIDPEVNHEWPVKPIFDNIRR